MSNFVKEELEDHKADLNEWVSQIQSHTVPDCKKRVVERFIRDCQTLTDDINKEESLSAEDLCDFVDRKNNLEIQYTNLTEEFE